MDAIAHTQVSGLCLVTLVVLLRAQQKMRDKSLPGRQFTALLWFAVALTIIDYGSALAQLGAWEDLGIPLTYRLNAGGSILFYLLAACCCLLVFLYVETELGHTWMEDGRRLALSAAPVTLLLLVLLTARDENGFCYLDAEGLRGSTLFWGAKLVGLAYLAAAFLRCSWTLSHWKQETPKEELKTLLLLALAPAAGFLLQGWLPGRGLLCCGITLGLVCVYVLVLQTKFTVDTLTGVSNRIVALRYLESELPYYRRHPNRSLHFLMMDMDHFKHINDEYGHLEGDAALVLLAGCLLVGVALPVWSAKRGDRVAREYRQALADTNSYVLESLRGLRDTLQYQDTAARAAGITAHSETLGEKQKALKYREGLTVAITNTLILFTVIAVLGVSLSLYQNGQLGVEGVLVCTLSALSSFGPVVALANLGASLTQVFASADRVLDLLDEEPVTADVIDGTDTAFAGAEAQNVSFSYADEEVLHDLSLTIPEKKIVGITGRSGSGKSTFLRLLMRFWDVSSGSIHFGEQDIRRVNTAALRAQESLVTQETELFDDTIENNIRIAKRDATHEEVEAACKKAALDGFIRSLPKGYDTPVGELGGALSGGERQRIGVARAFLHDAPFLLLDEPTSNLDSLNEGIILRAVRAECRDRTVLLVSHRKSTMAAADVSFSVESGRLS